MKKTKLKQWLYIAGLLCMDMSCSKEAVLSYETECNKLPTVITFKNEDAKIVWNPVDYPNIGIIDFTKTIESIWQSYPVCSLPKELQIDGLKIRCSGRTVKTLTECGPNVKGCNTNSVIIDSYTIIETPIKK